jgi:hypothetical protein
MLHQNNINQNIKKFLRGMGRTDQVFIRGLFDAWSTSRLEIFDFKAMFYLGARRGDNCNHLQWADRIQLPIKSCVSITEINKKR